MHLVGFIIRIYHDARSPERQIRLDVSVTVRSNSLSSLRCRGVYLTTLYLRAHVKEQRLCSVSIAISLNALLFVMLKRNQNRRFFFCFRIMKRAQTRYFPNESGKCLRDSGGDKKMEFRCCVNEAVNVSRSANLLKRQRILRATDGKATASLVMCVRPSVHLSACMDQLPRC